MIGPRRGLVPQRDGRQLGHLFLQRSDLGVDVVEREGLAVGRVGSPIKILNRIGGLGGSLNTAWGCKPQAMAMNPKSQL